MNFFINYYLSFYKVYYTPFTDGSFLQVYAEGPAQLIGGVAAIAILTGPDAPITFESRVTGTYMAHAYDFYKPNLASEYSVIFSNSILHGLFQ